MFAMKMMQMMHRIRPVKSAGFRRLQIRNPRHLIHIIYQSLKDQLRQILIFIVKVPLRIACHRQVKIRYQVPVKIRLIWKLLW